MTTSCPYCGSGDITYDPHFRYGACNNCGEEFLVRDYDPDWEIPFEVDGTRAPERVGQPYGRYKKK